MRHAQLLNEPLLEAQRRQRRHEPAVAVIALLDVIRRRAIDVEARVGENLRHTLRAARLKVGTRRRREHGVLVVRVERLVGEGLEALARVPLEVKFNVEVRVAVLAVHATAVGDNLGDFGAAGCCGGVVGGGRGLRAWGCRRGGAGGGGGGRRVFGGFLCLGFLVGDNSGCCDG